MTIEEFANRLKRVDNEILKFVEENKEMPKSFKAFFKEMYDIKHEHIDSILQEAKSKRTNFEKWKDEFTFEKFKNYCIASCSLCPVYCGWCREDINCDCPKLIREWANKRCEE